MATKASVKIGPGAGPLIVLKQPELSWRFECKNHTQGELYACLGGVGPRSVRPEGAILMHHGDMLPKDTQTFQLFAMGVLDSFIAQLIGEKEDAVSGV